jgi:hypothetical protein
MKKSVQFTATIHRFEKQGEKTGWTYIDVPQDLAQQLKPGNKKEFKVKGKLDKYSINRVSVFPMGGGRFILVLNAALRKGIGKKYGAMVTAQLQADDSAFIFNKDFMECLTDEPVALAFFNSLTGSHQRYFSKWIDDAKTEATITKRITWSVTALAKKQGYSEMIRSHQNKNA